MKWVTLTKEFPSLMSDDIKFKKIGEIKKIQIDPTLFSPVAKLARETYAQFIAELLAQDIVARIAGSKTSNTAATEVGKGFYKLHSGQRLIEFTANQCVVRNEKRVELLGEVTVRESDAAGGRLLQTLHAPKASLYIEGDELAPTLTMEVYNAAWRRTDGAEGLSQRYIIRGLVLPKTVTSELKTEDILSAVSTASINSTLKKGPTPSLAGLQSQLYKKIQRTLLEIQAEIHSRLVFGIGCVSMVLIGIGLGIMKKGGHLLGAFGASCIPAAVLIVCIMMGKNVAKNQVAFAVIGMLLMWIGLILLSLLAVGIFRKLLQN